MLRKNVIGRKYGSIKIFLYKKPLDYVKKVLDIPKDAVLDESRLPESSGCACNSMNTIYLFKRDDCSFEDFLSTVSHELGHLVEGGFKKNPPEKERYNKKHEEKAEHYENFVMQSYYIAKELFEIK